MGEDEAPVVTFTEHHGRYLLSFDYHPAAVSLLKTTVPGAMRRWVPGVKRWEISTDWAGPLAGAFVNAGIEVSGLTQANVADWFAPFAVATPTSEEGHRAYRKGLCKSCTTEPHRPGGTECHGCYRKRLTDQHHVKALLAEAGATRYPEALPARGSALTTRSPLEVDRRDGAAPEPVDRTAAVDVLIAAEHERSATCPVCGRRPPKGGPVHVACRTRLLHALDDRRAFTKARNRAFQHGLCTVCLVRPHRPLRGITCTRCAELVDVCRSLRCRVVPTIRRGRP